MAVALHDGHDVREEVAPLFTISEADRLREEDPFTAVWTTIAPTKVIARRSRFEVDLNRPEEKAVYRTPGDAWGLTVWQQPLPEDVLNRSLAIRADFYAAVEDLLCRKVDEYGRVVVYELHTYNHHRGGPNAPFDDPEKNPQVNLGTAYNPPKWRPVLDRFVSDLREHAFPLGPLDVRENIKFEGGYFAQWVGNTFPNTVCNLCIEFKKFFMDEWTGIPDPALLSAITAALQATVPGVLEELSQT